MPSARAPRRHGPPSIGISTVTLGLDRRPARARRALLAEAAAAGIDHLHVGDHVTFHGGLGFDGLLEAAALLNLQDVLPVHVGAYQLTLRHPTVVARQIAALAAAHPGRLVFAAGAGGDDPSEMTACGVDPRTRGRRMDESLAALKGLMSGHPVTLAGETIDLAEVTVVPAASGVPLLVAGRSTAALRRTARHGDGWLAIWVSADRFAEATARIAAEAERQSRDPAVFDHGLVVWCGIGAQSHEAERDLAQAMSALYRIDPSAFARWSPAGSAEVVAEFIAPYLEAGARTVSLIPTGRPEEAIAAAAEIRQLLLA